LPIHEVYHLHVKNLPSQCNISELKNIFEKFGDIANCKIINNKDRPSFALIGFKKGAKSAQQCADQAI